MLSWSKFSIIRMPRMHQLYLSTSSISLITSMPISIVPIGSVSMGSETNCKLPTASSRDFSSWKDNPIETRTRMIVGVIP